MATLGELRTAFAKPSPVAGKDFARLAGRYVVQGVSAGRVGEGAARAVAATLRSLAGALGEEAEVERALSAVCLDEAAADLQIPVNELLSRLSATRTSAVVNLGHQGVIARAIFRLKTTALADVTFKDDRSSPEGWTVAVDVRDRVVVVTHKRREILCAGNGDFLQWSYTITLSESCERIESASLRLEGVEARSEDGVKIRELLKGGSLIID